MRSQWQIDQGNACSCKGHDEYCGCQNVNRAEAEPVEDDDGGMLGFEDAYAIASKIEEMADRVKQMHKAIPGAEATWGFEIDDTRFKVVVTVDDSKPA